MSDISVEITGSVLEAETSDGTQGITVNTAYRDIPALQIHAGDTWAAQGSQILRVEGETADAGFSGKIQMLNHNGHESQAPEYAIAVENNCPVSAEQMIRSTSTSGPTSVPADLDTALAAYQQRSASFADSPELQAAAQTLREHVTEEAVDVPEIEAQLATGQKTVQRCSGLTS